MRYLHLLKYWTCENKFYLVFTTVLLNIGSIYSIPKCEATKEITGNNIWGLVGNQDTLCMITYSDLNIFGVNSTTNKSLSWDGYFLGCKDKDLTIVDHEFGNKTHLLVFKDSVVTQSSQVWYLPIGSSKPNEYTFPWSKEIQDDKSINTYIQDVAFLDENFYFACQDGGLARWTPGNPQPEAYLLGKKQTVPFSDLKKSSLQNTKVTSVYAAPSKKELLVTTPSKVWIYSVVDSSWDSTATQLLDSPELSFLEYNSVFTNPHDTTVPLYANIKCKFGNSDTTYLFKYNKSSGKWHQIMRRPLESFTFTPGNFLYSITAYNSIECYRDSSDSLIRTISVNEFSNRIIPNRDIEPPEFFYEILYLPMTNSTGRLWIGSSDGLLLSANEIPGSATGTFVQIKREPPVSSGLKNSYCRPGILTNSASSNADSKTMFVYNLSSDAKVTIKVFDYNMDLVKIIIKDQPRKSGKNQDNGRSTSKQEDVWNGTSASGKKCAPGVYYYKITASNGEKGFGKIVLAK